MILPGMSFFKSSFFALAVLMVTSREVLGHGTITGVAGANGVQAAGFGIIASTPRDGTTRRPFQQDTSIIRDREITSGRAGVCGRTLAGGNNDVQAQLIAAVNAGLPSASSTGELAMTLHQINGDGAGPYTCDVSTDGGLTFQNAAVITNVPGRNGRSRAKATDFPLVMQVSPNTVCAGGPSSNACIARCRNPAAAGPFGSCVAFTMSSNVTSTESTTTLNTKPIAISTTESAGAFTTNSAESTNTEPAVISSAELPASATESPVRSSSEAASAVASTASLPAEAIGASAAVAATTATLEKVDPLSAKPSPTEEKGNDDEVAGERENIVINNRSSPENSQNAHAPTTTPIKRVITSRIAGRIAGHWIDA